MSTYFDINVYRCRVCKEEVAYTQFAQMRMVDAKLCYTHWKSMI